MIFYLLLIFLFGLVILASLAILIIGIIKKRKKILITSAILFTIGALGCGFSAFAYTRKVMEYVRSKQFQNDAKNGAALVGETMGSASSGISSGLANTLDDEAIQKLAGKSATIFGKAIKTIASGLDSTLGNKNIFLDHTLINTGLEVGRAQEKYNGKTNNLEINIDYQKNFKGTLRVTNYDQNGRIIERVDLNVNAKAGQNNVEVFNFMHSDVGITTYYILSKA